MRMKVRKSLTITIPDETKDKLREMSDYAKIPLSSCIESLVDWLYTDWEYIVDRSKVLGQDYLHYVVERDKRNPIQIKVQLVIDDKELEVSEPQRFPKNPVDSAREREDDGLYTTAEYLEPVKEVNVDEKQSQMDDRIAEMKKQLEALQKEKSEYEQSKKSETPESKARADFTDEYLKDKADTDDSTDKDKGAVIKQGSFMY